MGGEMAVKVRDAFLLVGASIPAEGLPRERRFNGATGGCFFCGDV